MPVIKFPKGRIEKACDDGVDSCRPILEHVQVDLDKNRMVAADGVILAVMPIENDLGDTGTYLVHRKLFEIARREHVPRNFFTVADDSASFRNITVKNECDTAFPNVDEIIPDVSGYEFVLAIDAKRLLDLAQAICASGPEMIAIYAHPKKQSLPIYVESLDYEVDKGFGLIMPCSSSNTRTEEASIRNLPTS